MREFKRSQWLYDGSFDAGYACPGNIGADGLAIRSHCIQKVSYTKSTPRVIVNYVFNDRMGEAVTTPPPLPPNAPILDPRAADGRRGRRHS